MKIHVATNGCDGFAGTSESPVAGLKEARNRIRRIKAANRLSGPVEVVIHPGRYEIGGKGFTLTARDSGTDACPITYRAAEPGTVTLTGARKLDRIERAGEFLRADLAANGTADRPIDHLFCDGEWMRPARYPNFDPENPYYGGWLYVDGRPGNIYENGLGARDRFVCSDPRRSTCATATGR